MLDFFGLLLTLHLLRSLLARISRHLSHLLFIATPFEAVALFSLIIVVVMVFLVIVDEGVILVMAVVLVEDEGVFFIALIVGVTIIQLIIVMTCIENLGRILILLCSHLTTLLGPIILLFHRP